MSTETIINLLAPLAGGLAVYVAIRADLATLKARQDASDHRHDLAEREMGVLRQWYHSLRGDL